MVLLEVIFVIGGVCLAFCIYHSVKVCIKVRRDQRLEEGARQIELNTNEPVTTGFTGVQVPAPTTFMENMTN